MRVTHKGQTITIAENQDDTKQRQNIDRVIERLRKPTKDTAQDRQEMPKRRKHARHAVAA